MDEEAAGMGDVMNVLQDPADYFTWENQPPASNMSISAAEMGIEGPFRVRDVWRQNEIGEFSGSFSAEVPYHGVALIRVWN